MDRDTQYWMIQAMQSYGGSFIKSLSMAWLRADQINTAKLEQAFPEYVEKYTKLGLEMRDNQQ